MPAPGDNVPLAIPDVHQTSPAKEPPNISKLWSDATEDDIENHALTIEVEKQPTEVAKEGKDSEEDVEGLDLLKDDLSELTPAPIVEESKETAKSKAPAVYGIEALLGGRKPAQRDPDPIIEPTQREPAQRESVLRESAQREPAQRESVLRESVLREPALREPVLRESAQREPAQREPAQRESVLRESVQRETALRESAQRETAQRELYESQLRENQF